MKLRLASQLTHLLGTALLLILPTLSPADDTDIYDEQTGSGSTPLVMLSLDLRPNLGSTVCSVADLLLTFNELTDDALQLITTLTGADETFACPEAAYILRNGGDTAITDLNELKTAGAPLTRFDVLIGALKVVLSDLDGVQIGLMLNHQHNTNCAGPDKVVAGCSNGGYITLGFKELTEDDSNGARAAIMTKLSQIMLYRAGNIGALTEGAVNTGGADAGNCPVDENDNVQDTDGDGRTDDQDHCPNVNWKTQSNNESNKYPGCPSGTNQNSPDLKPLCTTGSSDSGTGNVIQTHSYQGRELFFEFFRYLTGQGVYNGHVGFDDYLKNSEDLNLPDDAPGLSWDPDIETGASYNTPLNADTACSRIYTINAMFQVSNQEADSDDAIVASKANGGMEGINLSGPNKSFDTVIEYLQDVDLADGTFGAAPNLGGKQNMLSYFIIDDAHINNTTRGYARAGGTGSPLPLGDDPAALVEELNSVFRTILSVSTTFVSASVPVNVFNRASIVDNVYLSLFQADVDDRPYWPGNVKKLKIEGLDTGTPTLVGANDEDAVANDGRIKFNALTFWTVTGDDYNGDPLLPADEDNNVFLNRDGRHVERGGSAQNTPGYIPGIGAAGDRGFIGDNNEQNNAAGKPARQVFWDDGSTLRGMVVDPTPSTPNSLLETLLYLSDDELDLPPGLHLSGDDPAAANDYVRYMRGQDVDDLDNDGDTAEARDWLFGDSLHAKPLPLNFGEFTDSTGSYSTTNPAIYIAVGSDDGFLRLIRNTTASGAESGQEIWAFMPQSTFKIQDELRNNAAGVDHPYGSDGAPVAVFKDVNGNGTIETTDGDTVTLIFGQRRGGKHYYALDVTDPEDPSLMWKITPTGDFAELGYTFSTPQVGKLRDDVSNPAKDIDVIVFGGGYDVNKDVRNPIVGTNDARGNALFVVNAKTGELIWKARKNSAGSGIYAHSGLKDSIAADVTAVDTNSDGYLDRVIAADTGGGVWRADLGTGMLSSLDDWKLVRLARLGRHDTNNRSNDRRFFHAADFVQTRDSTGAFDAIVLTSGDRANPKDLPVNSTAPMNYAFMIKDRNTGLGTAAELDYTLSDLGDLSDSCNLLGCSVDPADITKGWRISLTGATGEKGLAVPLTIGGTVFFTTYLPPGPNAGAACAPAEGSGRLYAVNLADATAAFNYNKSDDASGQDDETSNSDEDRYDDLLANGIPAEVVFIPPGKILAPDLTFRDSDSTNRLRTYWQLVEPNFNHDD